MLYAATKGRPGQLRQIDDYATHHQRASDLKRALATADAAGFIRDLEAGLGTHNRIIIGLCVSRKRKTEKKYTKSPHRWIVGLLVAGAIFFWIAERVGRAA